MAARSCSLAAGLVVALASTGAFAQGYQLDRYEPTPAGDAFTIVETPWYSSTRVFAAALSFDYAHDLLAAQFRDPNGNIVAAPAPIESLEAGHLDAAYSPSDRLGFSLSLPVLLAESGTAFAGVGPSGTTVGDPRAGVRVRLLGSADSPLSLSAAAYLWIPVGADDKLAGDSGVRGMARFIAGGVPLERVRWSATASLLGRGDATLGSTLSPAGNTVGSEVQVAGGARYDVIADRLAIGPEAVIGVSLVSLPSGQKRETAELFATGRYAIDDQLSLGFGFGGGIAGSPVPDARVLVSLAYAPSVRRLTSSFERVVVLPDENGHIGGVEVREGKHMILLDKPYASTELSKHDKAPRAVQATRETVAARTATLAKILPPSDRDRDGIVDAEDACPDRPGAANSDRVRNGCPPASEKVVVLPDADGHVGGVVVDDGKTKVVLDTAYASSEVTDNGVHAVPPAPPRAVDRTVAAVAQTLPPPDADEDGIVDREDACPDRAGVASQDPVRNGCPAAAEKVVVLPDPDGHIGGVEVDDGHGKTLINTAYASAEVGADGVAHAVAPASPRAVDHAIAAIAATLPVADEDHDGIRDELDVCPDRAGVASTDPLRNGCPAAAEKVVVLPDADGHVGGVEIDDGKNKVLLDTAYASAEVAGGAVHAISVPPLGPITRATAALATALPMPDRDDDGIADSVDACPTRPGVPSPNAARHGCPVAVEQVVVIPDENGHIGAVEVDDGHTKIVVDQAYGAAEVGADGIAHAVPAEAAEVSAKYGAAMAAQPTGARIILYFTERAEPARDLTGPIDNLVAELKSRADYRLEVIGHTDQTGSETINLKIGQERAQVIADKLIAAGVPSDRITVKSMGSKEPAVKRKSRKVVEPRNRRVEIWVR